MRNRKRKPTAPVPVITYRVYKWDRGAWRVTREYLKPLGGGPLSKGGRVLVQNCPDRTADIAKFLEELSLL